MKRWTWLAIVSLGLTSGCGVLGSHCYNVDDCGPGLTCDITEQCNDSHAPAGCFGICRPSCGQPSNSQQCGGACPSQLTCHSNFPLNCVCR